MAVEVGARGVVAESLKKASATIGMRGRAQNKLVRDAGKGSMPLFYMAILIEWEEGMGVQRCR
jgi:hypothetical protein